MASQPGHKLAQHIRDNRRTLMQVNKHCMLRPSHFQQVAQTHQGLQFLTDGERKTAKNVELGSAATSPLLAVNMAAVSLSFSNLECQNHLFL